MGDQTMSQTSELAVPNISDRRATAAFQMHPLITERYSARVFAPREVPGWALHSVFEAARWAPSSFNEQPWRYIVGTRREPQTFERLADCLASGNAWAREAPVLILSVASTRFARNGKPNRHALHDAGLANAQLGLQATALGLSVHQMAGFDIDQARKAFDIPEDFDLVCMIALGFPGDVAALSAALRDRETAPRSRRGQEEFVFGTWDKARPLEDASLASESEPGLAEQQAVLSFWFGDLDDEGLAAGAASQRWWKKDPAFDEELRQRFSKLHAALMADELAHWSRSARGRLASIIVLDQFSRNMFRDSKGMFASDVRALELSLTGIAAGMDLSLRVDERVFFMMPLMHSESLAVQDLAVDLFAKLAKDLESGSEVAQKRVANNLLYAEKHRDIVVQWGRFPHRNAVLGRESTAAELEFLKQPGSSF